MTPPANQQVWECPTCGYVYRAALPVKEVLCGKPHSKTQRVMVLIAGEPYRTETKGKSNVSSGKV